MDINCSNPRNTAQHPLNANNKAFLRAVVSELAHGTVSEEEIERRVNAFRAFLLDHTDVARYSDSAYMSFSENCLMYEQSDETVYYHDGSEEPRKIMKIYFISKDTYDEFSEGGTKENKPEACYYCLVKPKWYAESEDYYFNYFPIDRLNKDYSYFAKSFLGCFDYVRIVCFTWL